jgi:hypothetical protein
MTDENTGADALGAASSVLVTTPDVRDAPVSACHGLLSNSGGDVDRVVGVAVCRSATDWLDAWERAGDGAATELTCVDVESSTRSAAASAGGGGRPAATVRSVPDATDLETLGDTLTDLLTAADEERVAVCLHSLSDLLGQVDQRSAFKFVTTLSELARAHDGVAYVHLDSRAADARTVDVFSTAVDAVVEFDDDAEITVQ